MRITIEDAIKTDHSLAKPDVAVIFVLEVAGKEQGGIGIVPSDHKEVITVLYKQTDTRTCALIFYN